MQRGQLAEEVDGKEFTKRDRIHQHLARVKLLAAADTKRHSGPHQVNEPKHRKEDELRRCRRRDIPCGCVSECVTERVGLAESVGGEAEYGGHDEGQKQRDQHAENRGHAIDDGFR